MNRETGPGGTQDTTPSDDLELWRWVDRLTQSTRRKLHRDDGTTEWITIPSIWAQLTDPDTIASSGSGHGGHTAPSSKSPANDKAISVIMDITGTVYDALISHNLTPLPDTDKSLRRLAVHILTVADPDLTDWWLGQLRTWISQALDAMPKEDGAPEDRPIRGYRCTECAATHITRIEDGEPCRVPAVVAVFREHMVRQVRCNACGAAWWRGQDLDALVDYTRPDLTEITA